MRRTLRSLDTILLGKYSAYQTFGLPRTRLGTLQASDPPSSTALIEPRQQRGQAAELPPYPYVARIV